MSDILNNVFGYGELLTGSELEDALDKDPFIRPRLVVLARIGIDAESGRPMSHHGRTLNDYANGDPSVAEGAHDEELELFGSYGT